MLENLGFKKLTLNLKQTVKSVRLFGPIPSVWFKYVSIVCRPSIDNSTTGIPKRFIEQEKKIIFRAWIGLLIDTYSKVWLIVVLLKVHLFCLVYPSYRVQAHTWLTSTAQISHTFKSTTFEYVYIRRQTDIQALLNDIHFKFLHTKNFMK